MTTSKDNIVFLDFANKEQTDTQSTSYLVCKHCRNKTFTLIYEDGNNYPQLRCAACGSHLGRMGWAHDAPT